jgi:hypothetical protein
MDFWKEEELRGSLIYRRVNVALEKKELEYAYTLAKARNGKEKRFGAMTYGGVRNGIEAHLLGIVPEIAIAKYFNVSVDSRIFSFHGDDGIDLSSTPLGRIGVKSTSYTEEPYLRVEIEHFNPQIDTYVLCAYTIKMFDHVSVIGWATRDEVKTAKKIRFIKTGPLNYVLYEPELRRFA